MDSTHISVMKNTVIMCLVIFCIISVLIVIHNVSNSLTYYFIIHNIDVKVEQFKPTCEAENVGLYIYYYAFNITVMYNCLFVFIVLGLCGEMSM